ncbi:DUF2776 family protein [Clostridium perfringens]|nr:DUF2776 family protein [Clostridium perfringens]MDM0994949.1 DUF2776 family protein [Clostridium perfringens]
MNYYISILFRAIPLLMGIICLTYGSYIYTLGDKFGNGYIIASHVIIFFTAICIALFTTAATIIRQLINKYNSKLQYQIELVLNYDLRTN